MRTTREQGEEKGHVDNGAGHDPGYHGYTHSARLEFCPMKDLNLPSSYSEAVARYERLRGERPAEGLV